MLQKICFAKYTTEICRVVITFTFALLPLQEYSLNFYLRQAWQDPRLRFDDLAHHAKEIKMEEGMWDKIWIPDVFFRNEKRAMFHSVTIPNRLLRLNATGHLWYVTK